MRFRHETTRAFSRVDLLVVMGIVGMGVALVLPVTAAKTSQDHIAICGSNQRRLAYAALLYSIDWKGQLPTRSGCLRQLASGGPPASLQWFARLPIVGFDTTTIWTWETYGSSMYFEMPGTPVTWLGGLALMMRDHLKNNFDAYVCPDGYYSIDHLLQKWDGTVSEAGPMTYPVSASGWGGPGLLSHKTGYLWLPHRPGSTGRAGECVPNGTVTTTDQPTHIAQTASSVPELLITADMNHVADRYYNVTECPAKGGCGLEANHMTPKFQGLPIWETACLTPVFPPNIGKQEDPKTMPAGMNRARLDARVGWLGWKDWQYFRWAFHPSAGWHSF